VTTLFVDTSVIVKWFHHENETGVAASRAICRVAQAGEIQARVIDIALYEMGNALL
jgi:predicted nucleic acid-binding protein